MNGQNHQKLLDYSLKLLSFRPRSCQEMTNNLDKFAKKNTISQKDIGQVIQNLKKQNLLNDRQFVQWWILQRRSEKPKGIRAIKYELRLKGIDRNLIEEVLDEKQSGLQIDYEMAKKIINKKKPFYKNLPAMKSKIKISQLLYRRGFTWDVVSRIIDSELQKE